MTLDEAIKHAEDKAEEQKYLAQHYSNGSCSPKWVFECQESAAEHKQLAEWLKELKQYKENDLQN